MHVSHIPDQTQYLTHLFGFIKGRDITYRNFIKLSPAQQKGKVLLRHDVDDKLAHSVAMAELQHQCGVCATYFILDTAPYWNPADPDMWLKINRIAELGHEIAWHNNVLSRHITTGRPVDELITEPLLHFQQHGYHITGSASHGDNLCYKHGFINYEVFEECPRPANSTFPKPSTEFPKVRMSDYILEYEAYFLPRDHYFSESGGLWKELPQAKHFEDTGKITHILIHPQWWTL